MSLVKRSIKMGGLKMANKTIKIEPIKETTFEITIEGDGDLILHGRPRQYSLSEIWRQSNPKGSDMPTQFKQPRNLWEERITAIHWEKPIEFHDEDISLYSEEEWNRYMKENRPCFLPSAFYKSFAEAFITFFKEGTGKKGTDFRRSINMHGKIYPVNFSTVRIEDNLIPINQLATTTVLGTCNIFSGWECTISLSSADIVFPPETVLQVVDATGKYIGIGTQRSNGFGRYHIKDVKII